MGEGQPPVHDERRRLLARREELRARLEAIRSDVRRGLEADFEERAIQLQNDEVLAGIAEATAGELADVEARLAELDK